MILTMTNGTLWYALLILLAILLIAGVLIESVKKIARRRNKQVKKLTSKSTVKILDETKKVEEGKTTVEKVLEDREEVKTILTNKELVLEVVEKVEDSKDEEKVDYSKFSVVQLKDLCRERKIVGFSTMNKSGLIKVLKEYDNK